MTYCDNCGEPQATNMMHHVDRLPVAVASANIGESASLCGDCSAELMPHPWVDPTDPRFVPPVVINPFTGADYDTLLTILSGWVVQVHLIVPDGREHIGVVANECDNHIHLTNDSEGHTPDEAINLANVRWIQVL